MDHGGPARLIAPDLVLRRTGLLEVNGYHDRGNYVVRRAAAGLDLTVERLDDGAVSTFLHVVEQGDTFEVPGPISGGVVSSSAGGRGGANRLPRAHTSAQPPERCRDTRSGAPRLSW